LRDGNSDIWLTTRDGSSTRNLTEHPANDFLPCWHPDGVHLVWISDRDGTECMYCMNTSTARIHRLNDEISGSPVISPDAKLIAFEVPSQAIKSLRVHHLDDQLQLGPLIFRLDSKVEIWAGYRPRFSPDGMWLGYQAPVEPAGSDIFVVPASNPGAPPIRLTVLPTTNFKAHWWDWIDANHLVVSYFPIQARLVLLRDADRWFDRALMGR
jgi:Tol biopolymer transport system component